MMRSPSAGCAPSSPTAVVRLTTQSWTTYAITAPTASVTIRSMIGFRAQPAPGGAHAAGSVFAAGRRLRRSRACSRFSLGSRDGRTRRRRLSLGRDGVRWRSTPTSTGWRPRRPPRRAQLRPGASRPRRSRGDHDGRAEPLERLVDRGVRLAASRSAGAAAARRCSSTSLRMRRRARPVAQAPAELAQVVVDAVVTARFQDAATRPEKAP